MNTVLESLAAELKDANDNGEIITLRLQDLRDVLHDAIGDVKRYGCDSSYHYVAPEYGEWMKVEDVERLESWIVTSLIDERLE